MEMKNKRKGILILFAVIIGLIFTTFIVTPFVSYYTSDEHYETQALLDKSDRTLSESRRKREEIDRVIEWLDER